MISFFVHSILRYEASSLDGDTTHREQDFGYEVIDQPATAADISMMEEDDDDRESDMIQTQQQAVESGERFQYRGTPERERKVPSRNKRRQQAQHRYSQDVAEQVSSRLACHLVSTYVLSVSLRCTYCTFIIVLVAGSDNTRHAVSHTASTSASEAARRTACGYHRRLRRR